MIGENFWDNFDISVQTVKMEVAEQAKELLNEYGEDLTQEDILKLSANTKWAEGGIDQALAKFILEGYKERCIVLKDPEPVEIKRSRRDRIVAWFKKGLK